MCLCKQRNYLLMRHCQQLSSPLAVVCQQNKTSYVAYRDLCSNQGCFPGRRLYYHCSSNFIHKLSFILFAVGKWLEKHTVQSLSLLVQRIIRAPLNATAMITNQRAKHSQETTYNNLCVQMLQMLRATNRLQFYS